jgi:hypothetical protein
MLKGGKHDFRTDLVIKDTERRFAQSTIEILGVIENHGKVNWENIVVQADLYGKDKKFLGRDKKGTFVQSVLDIDKDWE